MSYVYKIVSLGSNFQPSMAWLWGVSMFPFSKCYLSLTGQVLKKLEVGGGLLFCVAFYKVHRTFLWFMSHTGILWNEYFFWKFKIDAFWGIVIAKDIGLWFNHWQFYNFLDMLYSENKECTCECVMLYSELQKEKKKRKGNKLSFLNGTERCIFG